MRAARGVDPRVEAARILQSLRIAKVRLSRLSRRLEAAAAKDKAAKAMLEVLYKIDYLLELASLKMETYVATGIVSPESIEAALTALRIASNLARGAPPELASTLLEAEEAAIRVASALDITIPPELAAPRPVAPTSSEAKAIMEEASRAAKSRLRELLK